MVTNRLKEWRLKYRGRGLSKAALARRMQVSRSYVTKLEQGKTLPSLVLALQFARYLGCSVHDLFELQAVQSAGSCCAHVLPNGHIAS